MKIFSLSVLYKGTDGKVKPLAVEHELSSFGYFQKSSVKEFMDFTSKIVVERTTVAQRTSIREQEYMCHAFVRADGLSGVLIADHEYPQRVSFNLLSKILDDFTARFPSHEWPTVQTPYSWPDLKTYLDKFQNPSEADAMSKVQKDLDETKVILHNTIEAVLERGEKLDDLVEKSEGLSMQSKAFYKTAKKTNSCCTIL